MFYANISITTVYIMHEPSKTPNIDAFRKITDEAIRMLYMNSLYDELKKSESSPRGEE